tara:strand:+ start:7401 stop:8774 length:1374 start_codon:yes stop_codon:yes gene_type:complete
MSNGPMGTTQQASEAAKQQEAFNQLVAQFAGLFGIDEETIVDFYTVINAPVDPDTGLNKYNLTKANVDALKKYFDPENYNYEAAQELLTSISTVGTTGIEVQQLEQAVTIGLNNPSLGINEILQMVGVSSAQDRARDAKAGRMVPDYDEAGNLIPDGKGGYKMKPFAGHFSEDYHYLINSLSGEQDIIDFQNYLIENKVVDPAFFLGSEGQYSSQLEGAVVMIMNWMDQNRYIGKNTDEWNSIMSSDPVFFTESQFYDYDSINQSIIAGDGLSSEVEANWRSKQENLKLFNYAVQEFSKLRETELLQQRNVLESEIINELKKTYRVASPIQRKELVDDWFFQKLGRKGTQEEINDWANEIAVSLSTTFKETASNLLALQEAVQAESWAKDYLGNFPQAPLKSFEDMTDISDELSLEDPYLRSREKFEQTYGKEMKAHEMGALKKKQQTAVLKMMLGT